MCFCISAARPTFIVFPQVTNLIYAASGIGTTEFHYLHIGFTSERVFKFFTARSNKMILLHLITMSSSEYPIALAIKRI